MFEMGERVDHRAVRIMVEVVRKAGGELVCIREHNTVRSTGPAATRLREIFGPDFYVERDGRRLLARARRRGEPQLFRRKLRMGPEWMTLDQACERLGITSQWIRRRYLGTALLPRYKVGSRVVLKTADVEAIAATLVPGGVWVNQAQEGA
jgi:hypothetical protein